MHEDKSILKPFFHDRQKLICKLTYIPRNKFVNLKMLEHTIDQGSPNGGPQTNSFGPQTSRKKPIINVISYFYKF